MSKKVGWAVSFIIVLGFLLTNCRPCRRPELISIDQSFYNKIEIITFSPEETVLIRHALIPLATPRCNEAFRRAGLRSPLEVIVKDGVVIRPSYDLYRFTAKELGLTDNRIRRAYMAKFSDGDAQAGTVSPVMYGTPRTIDGRARIFLHDTAFLESALFRRLSLSEVLVHEFIHVAGQPPAPGWFGSLRDDLASFAPYGEVMEACR